MRYVVDLVWAAPTLGWFGFTMAIAQILGILTIPSVLLQRQGQPRAALSWLLMMFAVPPVGVIGWWAFGRTSLARKQRRRAERAREFAGKYGMPHTERGTSFDDVVPPRALGESIFTSRSNGVDLLFDGPSAYPAMEQAIASATRTIHVMFYIFRDDPTGRRFRDLLVEKARAGVTVRILIDAWGSPRFTGKFSKPLREAGAKVAAFLPSHFMPLLAPRFNFANHRKLVVVDEKVAFVGGMNIGDEYATSWHDIMARVRGPAVRALEHVFFDDWFFASGEDIPHVERRASVPAGDVACAVVASGPDRDEYIHDAYFMMLTRAARRVWLVTPYFIPSDAIATALRTAASRGVDVQLLLPLSSDIGIVKHAARSFYRELLVAGARIFEYQGPMLHAKAFVVDDHLTAVGSANIDSRSFRLNFEIQCFLDDANNNTILSRWFESLRADAHEVTLAECDARSTPEKLLESVAHLWSPML